MSMHIKETPRLTTALHELGGLSRDYEELQNKVGIIKEDHAW